MGGELHQCSTVCLQAVRRRHNTKCFCALRAGSNAVLAVKYAGAGPHPSRGFPACPWKICVAASRLPCLFCLYAGDADTGGRFSLQRMGLEVLCRTLRVHPLCCYLSSRESGPTYDKKVSCRMWVRFLCLRHVSKGEPLKARRKTVREYRHAHRTRPAFAAGQFVRAALYLCGLLLTRSPAPRPDIVRPLKKLAASSPV